MTKTEINNQIITIFNQKLNNLGLADKLYIYPITNTFTKRPHYWQKDGKCFFKVHMWDLNKLIDDELEKEIDNRIILARKHFNI